MHDPSAHITPRDLRFELDHHADRAWLDGDLLHSILVDSFAVMLPVGERFFIRSLRHYEAQIPDAFVRLGITGYATQEAFHTREHEAYNRGLRALGYDPDEVSERLRRLLPQSSQPGYSLLVTCAIEHITYTLSRVILDHPELFARAKPAYRELWVWHALEEVEHANVALAVLAEVGRGKPALVGYIMRCMAFNVTLFKFVREAVKNAHAMKRAAGLAPGWRSWSRIAWLILGRQGWMRRGLPHLLAYYRPGYGRGSTKDEAVIANARTQLASLLAMRPAPG